MCACPLFIWLQYSRGFSEAQTFFHENDENGAFYKWYELWYSIVNPGKQRKERRYMGLNLLLAALAALLVVVGVVSRIAK